MVNCHYVPQFIQRQFDKKLDVFKIKEQEYIRRNVVKLFSKEDLYPADLEEDFNLKLEQPFSELLHKKLLESNGDIILTAKERFLVQRFLIAEMLRDPSTKEYLQRYFDSVRKVVSVLPQMAHFSKRDLDEYDSEGSLSEYWYRSLRYVLDHEKLQPDDVGNDPESTFIVRHWSSVIYAGYIGIWDADETEEEFILTDEGMASERDSGLNCMLDIKGVDGEGEVIGAINIKDLVMQFATKIYDSMPGLEQPYKIQAYGTWYGTNVFQDNFMMFHISAKRMLVVINPFFKFFCGSAIFIHSSIDNITKMGMHCFIPNDSTKKQNAWREGEDEAQYTYHPVKLTSEEVEYCNMLWMDRAYSMIAATSFNKVKGSIAAYAELAKVHKERNDYSELYRYLGIDFGENNSSQ